MWRSELSCNETIVNPSSKKQLLNAEHHCLRKPGLRRFFLPLFTPARLLVESGGLWREAARSPVKAATNCEIKTNQKLHPTGHNDGTYAFAFQTFSSPPLPTAGKKS